MPPIQSRQISSQSISNKGFALVVVIVVMLLSTFLASQLILLVRTELKMAHNAKMRASGIFLSEAGVNLALFRILDKPIEYEDEEYEQFLHGYMYEASLPNGKVQYYAVNESGKINLNTFQRGLLQLFLEYHEMEEDQIEIVLDCIQDWRDADNLHSLNGAEKDYYEELEPPYIPRNGKIADPAEFFLIKGTETLIDRFSPEEIFTVHNTKRTINFNSLTPAMLDFLVEGDPEKKALYYEMQQEFGHLRQAQALEILGAERHALLRPYLDMTTRPQTLGRSYYTIVAIGQKITEPDADLAEEEEVELHIPGTKLSVLAEVRGRSYEYLSWREKRI